MGRGGQVYLLLWQALSQRQPFKTGRFNGKNESGFISSLFLSCRCLVLKWLRVPFASLLFTDANYKMDNVVSYFY